MDKKVKNDLFKFIRELSLWEFLYLKLFHKIRKSIDRSVCGVNCDSCKALKLRRQFSMTPEEGFEMLTVSYNIISKIVCINVCLYFSYHFKFHVD